MLVCVDCDQYVDPVEEQTKWGDLECRCGGTLFIEEPDDPPEMEIK